MFPKNINIINISLVLSVLGENAINIINISLVLGVFRQKGINIINISLLWTSPSTHSPANHHPDINPVTPKNGIQNRTPFLDTKT